MTSITFHQKALEQYQEWAIQDKKIFSKINGFIKEIVRTPFSGTGQPEPLKHGLAGYWSRRITQEHRLVYEVTDKAIVIISCKYHYQ